MESRDREEMKAFWSENLLDIEGRFSNYSIYFKVYMLVIGEEEKKLVICI